MAEPWKGSGKGRRYVSGTWRLFPCCWVNWAKKFPSCLSSSELGLLSVASTRVLANLTSTPKHHIVSTSPPTEASATTHPATPAPHHPYFSPPSPQKGCVWDPKQLGADSPSPRELHAGRRGRKERQMASQLRGKENPTTLAG